MSQENLASVTPIRPPEQQAEQATGEDPAITMIGSNGQYTTTFSKALHGSQGQAQPAEGETPGALENEPVSYGGGERLVEWGIGRSPQTDRLGKSAVRGHRRPGTPYQL